MAKLHFSLVAPEQMLARTARKHRTRGTDSSAMDTLAGISRSRALAHGAIAVLLMVAAMPGQTATTCAAESGAQTVPLVELFTSEGCDSCPPADRWLTSQFPAAGTREAVSVLAFHVDYWDRLGWKDRFATAEYTQRQHDAMRANGATFVYTPQVLAQGHDVPSWRAGKVGDILAAARKRPARADVKLAIDGDAGVGFAVRAQATVADRALRKDAVLWVAYADSGLVSDVKAGENRGARLSHDHVVRAFATGANREADGRLSASATFARPRENGTQPTVVAFVQRPATGEVLQAVALPLTDCLPP